MLAEIADITKCTTWCDVKSKVSSHPHYKAVVSDSYEEDWFNEYLEIVNYLKTNFMKRLSEIPGINNSTTWSDVKWKVNSDIRYKFYVSNSHQEDWFQEYLKNLYNAKNDFMKRLSGMPGIKNSTPWSDVKKYADSYPGFEAFSNSHLENWFREYLKTLSDVKNDFMKRLSEIPGINHSTTWSEVESKVSPDPCSEDLFSNSHRENWFREYLKTLDDVKNDFMNRLHKLPGIDNGTTWSDVKSKMSSGSCPKALFGDSHWEDWFKEFLITLNDAKNDFMKRLNNIPGINNSKTWSDVKSKVSSDPHCETLFSDYHREKWFWEYLNNLNNESL